MLLYSVPRCDIPVPPGAVVSSIDVEGSAITYQCGEGLVAEGQSLQALCGADRDWSQDLIMLTCRERGNLNNSDAISYTNTSEVNGKLAAC